MTVRVERTGGPRGAKPRRSPEQEFGDLQEYDDLSARLYSDEDIAPGTRELGLALAWLHLRDPERHDTELSLMRRVGDLLGRDQVGRWRHKELFAEDAPRYELPRGMWASHAACTGPRVRPYRPRGAPAPPPSQEPLVCGANGQIRVPERDLVTGRISRVHWFCRRHEEHAKRVEEQVKRAGEPPPALPNTGGRLPRYFQAEGLVRVYEWARPGWKPPFHGMCADDWVSDGTPVLIPMRPRLAVVGTEGERKRRREAR